MSPRKGKATNAFDNISEQCTRTITTQNPRILAGILIAINLISFCHNHSYQLLTKEGRFHAKQNDPTKSATATVQMGMGGMMM